MFLIDRSCGKPWIYLDETRGNSTGNRVGNAPFPKHHYWKLYQNARWTFPKLAAISTTVDRIWSKGACWKGGGSHSSGEPFGENSRYSLLWKRYLGNFLKAYLPGVDSPGLLQQALVFQIPSIFVEAAATLVAKIVDIRFYGNNTMLLTISRACYTIYCQKIWKSIYNFYLEPKS